MRPAARLLSGVFAGAVRLRNSLYDAGALPSRSLQGPVISVGNLSVGGAGKTPFVILLGELLKQRGLRFDVLTRGYGRQSEGVKLVDAAGAPRDFGDEPLLIARRLQAPVIIGEDRYAAGLFSERTFGPQLHLLDDGFQHRQLARTFDIVLVTPDDARDRLLPAGRLREPLAALRRADAVVLTSGAEPSQFPLQQKTVWRVRRGILPRNVPEKPVAFCGIARPQSFFVQLRKAGVEPAAEAVFPDHYTYNEKDVSDLQFLRGQSGAGGFVTTEKDAVNLGAMLPALEPLAVVPVRMDLVDAARALDTILDTLARRGKPAP
jgi:tetraacyldisaccharide 4'-kinase